jgi:hypothetical protein
MRKKMLKWISAVLIAGLLIADIGVIIAAAGGPSSGNDPSCDSGGPGAITCSIQVAGGIAGFGGSFECSVTCGSGYYACCSVSEMGCNCKPSLGAGSGGNGSSN